MTGTKTNLFGRKMTETPAVRVKVLRDYSDLSDRDY